MCVNAATRLELKKKIIKKKISPAAFNEGDFQSTFHQPGVLKEQV